MKPLPSLPQFWSFWPHAPHRAEIHRWLSTIPCAWSDGSLSSRHEELTAFEIEASLRRVIREWNWTGVQATGNPHVDSTLDLLRWQLIHSSDNSNLGPTWACGPLSGFYTGILAAMDIPARRAWTSSWLNGQVDYGVEVWSREARSWFFVVPHLGLHFERMDGTRCSFIDWATRDRCGGFVQPVALTGNGTPAHSPDLFNRYRGMGGNPHVERGNWRRAGGSGAGNPDAPNPGDDIRARHANSPSSWQHLQLMPRIGAALEFVADPPSPAPAAHGTFDLSGVLGEPSL